MLQIRRTPHRTHVSHTGPLHQRKWCQKLSPHQSICYIKLRSLHLHDHRRADLWQFGGRCIIFQGRCVIFGCYTGIWCCPCASHSTGCTHEVRLRGHYEGRQITRIKQFSAERQRRSGAHTHVWRDECCPITSLAMPMPDADPASRTGLFVQPSPGRCVASSLPERGQ